MSSLLIAPLNRGMMDKQEEILEGIALKLYEFDGGTMGHWASLPRDRKEYRYRAKLMAEHLDSQDLVVMVDGNYDVAQVGPLI